MNCYVYYRGIFLFIFGFIFNVNTATLFPHGKQNGDTIVIDSKGNTLTSGTIDDGIKLINIPKFPFFGKKNNNKLQISTNGYVVFGPQRIFNSPTPTKFPLNFKGFTVPIIAVFWSDLYFQNISTLSYQIHSSPAVLNRATSLIRTRYKEDILLQSNVVVITWYKVKHKQTSPTQSYTFQLALTTDGKSSFAIFLYDSLPKNVAAVVGFQEKLNIYRFRYSLERQVAHKLLTTSNINMNGIRVYKIADEVLDCSKLNDGPHAHPTHCQKYIVCKDKVAVEIKHCNESQHFHPNFMFCVPVSQYPCHAGKDNSNPINPCMGKSDGNYIDPENCSKYIQCTNEMYHQMSCPTGLYFNQGGKPGSPGYCDWPFNVKCKTKT